MHTVPKSKTLSQRSFSLSHQSTNYIYLHHDMSLGQKQQAPIKHLLRIHLIIFSVLLAIRNENIFTKQEHYF
jgi:hypothetical protein